jgi:hypothetical protein
MMIVDTVSKGELREVAFDTYVRGPSKNENAYPEFFLKVKE